MTRGPAPHAASLRQAEHTEGVAIVGRPGSDRHDAPVPDHSIDRGDSRLAADVLPPLTVRRRSVNVLQS